MLLFAAAALAAEDADALAHRIAGRCGDPYARTEISFTFVVVRDGVEKARRHHDWHPADDTLTVQMGEKTVSFTKLSEKTAPGASQQDIEDAWGAFVNDSYWLLAPCKVLDPGVSRSVDEKGRLALTFDHVGLTPGDRYWLTADAAGNVTRWDFVLENGRDGHYAWAPPKAEGPLWLSPSRSSDDGKSTIRFEDLAVR